MTGVFTTLGRFTVQGRAGAEFKAPGSRNPSLSPAVKLSKGHSTAAGCVGLQASHGISALQHAAPKAKGV